MNETNEVLIARMNFERPIPEYCAVPRIEEI